MTYLGRHRPLSGCATSRRGTGAPGAPGACGCGGRCGGGLGFGDVAPATGTSAIASAGIAKALAADPAFAKAVMLLKAQISRYGSRAPVGYQFAPTGLAIGSGVLDAAAAAAAVAILQRRYQNAAVRFAGESDQAIAKLRTLTSALAMEDPVTWVMAPPGTIAGTTSSSDAQVGVDAVTILLAKYGDSMGLAAAPDVAIYQFIPASLQGTTGLVVAGLAAGAAYLTFFRKSSRRTRRR